MTNTNHTNHTRKHAGRRHAPMMATMARRPFLISFSSKSLSCSADLPFVKFRGSCTCGCLCVCVCVCLDACVWGGGGDVCVCLCVCVCVYMYTYPCRRGEKTTSQATEQASTQSKAHSQSAAPNRTLTKPRSQGLSEVYVLSSVASSIAAMTGAGGGNVDVGGCRVGGAVSLSERGRRRVSCQSG
jgi:hypothetical protein